MLAAFVAALAFAAPAQASKSIVNTIGNGTSTGTLGAQFNFPRGVAVNKTGNGGVDAGTFYVVDTNNRRIQRFNPDGSFAAAWGWDVSEPDGDAAYEICTEAESCRQADGGTAAGQFSALGAQTAAVDQDTGVVYVSDQLNRRINVYAGTGEFQGAFGWGVADGTVELQYCTDACGTASPAGGDAGRFGGQIGGLAVSTAGQIYVANKTNRRVDVFTPTYTGDVVTGVDFTRAFGWGVDTGAAAFEVCTTASTCQAPAAAGTGDGQFGTNSPTEVAFDASGRLLALDGPNKRIQLFDVLTDPDNPSVVTSSYGATAITDTYGAGNLYSLVTDQATDHAFLVGQDPASSPINQIRVLELDNTGAEVDVHGTDLTPTNANGIGVAPPALGGNIYVASNQGGHRLFVLNQPPEATLDAITVFDTSSATFSGTADPTGGGLECTFQYSTNGADWTDVPATDCDSLDPNGGPQAISEDVTGLEPGTLYRVRLQVVKAGGAGTVTTAPRTFATDPVPPLVNDTSASNVGQTGATLEALIHPKGQQTTYYFQYTDEDDFQANGFDNAVESPDPPASAGSGSSETTVTRAVGGLEPGTTYRFRVVIENPSGVVEGDPESFTTYAPDPSFGECENDDWRTGPSATLPDCRAYEQASPMDKNGIDVRGLDSAMAAASDGNSVLYFSPNGQPGGVGSQSHPFYLARRSEDGWSATGVKPPASYGDIAGLLGWTPDLSTFLFGTTATDSGAQGVYFRSSDDGVFTQVSDQGSADLFLGSSDDGRISYFEGRPSNPLTPDAPSGVPSIYAYNHETGELRLAGVLPDAACASPPCLPATGSEIAIDYPIESRSVTSGGDLYFSTPNGQLYLRKDPFGSPSTVRVSANHGSEATAPRPARFELSTADGEHAFFTSAAALTDESNTGSDEDPPAIGRLDAADGANLETNLTQLPDTPPGAVAVDENHLYWIEPDANSIGRSDLDGSNVEHDFITGLDNAKDLAVDHVNDRLYWTNARGDGFGASNAANRGSIGRADLSATAGGDATNVDQECIKSATTGSPQDTGIYAPRGIDVGDEGATEGLLYWTNSFGRIARAPVAGSCAAADAGKELAYFNAGGLIGESGDLVVTADSIYKVVESAAFSDQIIRVDAASGTQVDSVNLPYPKVQRTAITVTDSHFFYANAEQGFVGRADLDFSNSDDGFVTGLTAPISLDVGVAGDAGHLYWATGISTAPRGNALYRFDSESGGLTDLTAGASGPIGADVRGVLGASADGEYVYFAANGDLDGPGPATDGDCRSTPGDVGEPRKGQCNIYLAHDGELTFVERVDTDTDYSLPGSSNGHLRAFQTDARNWEPQKVGATDKIQAKLGRVSADGSTLMFVSRRSLTGYDNVGAVCGFESTTVSAGPCPQLYRFEIGEGVSCLSCTQTGAPPQGERSFETTSINYGGTGTPKLGLYVEPRYVSTDGQRAIFESTERLVAADTNSVDGCRVLNEVNTCLDVYEWEAEGKGSCEVGTIAGGCVHLLSKGTGSYASFFLGASDDGDTAFIITRDRLVPQDEDDLQDAYAVRVGGGLASQHEDTSAQGCTGDDCQGPAESPPAAAQTGSGSFTGKGNKAPSADPSDCSSEQRKLKKAKRKLRKAKRAKGKRASSNLKRAKAKKRLKRAKKAKRKAQKRLRGCKGGER